MNIFNKYGIKEVADVTFYSITRIGDEEFYTPVLFFDTLKVSTLDKSVETVNATGGKGNGKILSWNFGKGFKLDLEDALFSQMSMDMFMNGRVMAKMSDWTSAIAKLNVANKYGQKNYSVKAYPSPKLTEAEWDIVFRCAQKAGYNSKTGLAEPYNSDRFDIHSAKYLYSTDGYDEEEDEMVAENRKWLVENYYNRTQPTFRSYDLAPYIDCNEIDYDGIQILINEIPLEDELDNARTVAALPIGKKWGKWLDLTISFRDKSDENYIMRTRQSGAVKAGSTQAIVVQLNFQIEKRVDGLYGTWAYISASGAYNPDEKGEVLEILKKILTGWEKDNSNTLTFEIGNEFLLSHLPYFIFPHYLEDAIGDLCWCDQQDNFYLAMPQKIIDFIAEEIDDFSKTGKFENDLYEAQTIDRFEKCIVSKRGGLKINLQEQIENIKKQYNNESGNYTVYYDAKTMLPFMTGRTIDEKIYSQKCFSYLGDESLQSKEDFLPLIKGYMRNQYPNEWVDSLTVDDFTINRIITERGSDVDKKMEYISSYTVEDEEVKTIDYDTLAKEEEGRRVSMFIYFSINKRDYFTLKYGTVYYKWSRTIDEDNTDTSFIGTDLSIDEDIFSGEYMIVGETYIREQKTGKDQRYQFLLSRAAITASTKVQLQASGGPSVFSISVDVLAPLTKKKSMVELRQYNVEEDKRNGGYVIVPQNKKHSYTPIAQSYDEIVINNNEIY